MVCALEATRSMACRSNASRWPYRARFPFTSAPARGPDHFPFQGFRDSGIGSQGVRNSLELMCKTKTTVRSQLLVFELLF